MFKYGVKIEKESIHTCKLNIYQLVCVKEHYPASGSSTIALGFATPFSVPSLLKMTLL